MGSEELQGGWLAHRTRWRGWQAPPRRQPVLEERRHRFSTTQLTCRAEDARLVQTAQRLLAVADVDPQEGLEAAPHITIRYGLATDAPGPVVAILGAYAPLSVTIGPVHVFEPEDEPYDVVVLRLESEALRSMNAALREADIPQTDTQAGYVPHLTLGYVRKGRGVAYRGLQHGLLGQVFSFSEADFIDRDGICTTIPLAGRGQDPSGPLPEAPVPLSPTRRAGPLVPLLATATVLPPLDWAPLHALAPADARRRQAQAFRQEEEELLVLLMLVEVL